MIHSFWVPRLAGKIDAIPGHETRDTAEGGQAGTFGGICAEYCGNGHSAMLDLRGNSLHPAGKFQIIEINLIDIATDTGDAGMLVEIIEGFRQKRRIKQHVAVHQGDEFPLAVLKSELGTDAAAGFGGRLNLGDDDRIPRSDLDVRSFEPLSATMISLSI